PKLLVIVASRLLVKNREINRDRDQHYEAIMHLRLAGGCMGRALKRLDVFERITSNRINAHLVTYKSVATEYSCREMYSNGQLADLLEEIRKTIRFGIGSLKELIHRDCHACGDWIPGMPEPVDQMRHRFTALEGRLTDVAQDTIRVWAAEAA